MQFSTDKLSKDTKPFKFSVTKDVSAFRLKLNWSGKQDVDLSFIGLGADGKIDTENYGYVFFYYWINNGKDFGVVTINSDGTYETSDGALKHSRDVLDGSTQAEDEWGIVTPSKISPSIKSIQVLASVHTKNVSFGNIMDTQFTIENAGTGEVLQAYNLTKDFGNAKIIVLGELVNTESGWEFAPLGHAHESAGLEFALRQYGVEI